MYDIIPWLGGVKTLLVLTVVIVGFVTIGVWWMLTPSRVLRRAALATNEVHNKLNVRNLSNELSAVTGWYPLGIRLGIPSHELGKIEQNYSSDVDRRMTETLSLWLRYTPSASWKDVVIALQQMGENVLAERIHNKYIGVATYPTQEDSGAVAIARENRQRINCKFGVLLKNSCKKLREKHINVKDFRLFLKGLFPPGYCIPESSNIDEIFEAITHNQLWNYWNFYPLQKVIHEFVGDDQELKSWIETYKKDLTSYKATTRLVDYIAVVDSDPSSEDSSSEEQVEEQQPAKYDRRYYRKLSIKLETKFTSHTLEYLDDLWKEFADLYNLPPLGTLLDCVCKNSVIIVWLIPAHLTLRIFRATPHSIDFFHKHQVTKVEFDGLRIYPEAKEYAKEPQPVHQAASLLPTKPMEEIARKNREIEQLQMQMKAKIKESELTIQDLEAENLELKQKLFQEEKENKSAPEMQIGAVALPVAVLQETHSRRKRGSPKLDGKKQKATVSPSRRRKSAEAERSDEYFEQQVQQGQEQSNGGGTYGGYDCEFIEPPPSVYQTECPICRRILCDPYEAMCCGYSFCYTCIQRFQRDNSTCPWCRKGKYEVRKNMGMKLALNQLGVYCTYSIDGCTWRGELRELQAHVDETDHSEYERPTNKSPPCQQDNESKMEWKQKKDIPVAMNAHHIVRIGNNVYCGGGFTGKLSTDKQVFKYNCKEDKWSHLPICPSLHFGLTQLDEKLVIVGGRDSDALTPIKDMYIFEEDSQTWKNSNKPLSIARCSPCAFAYRSGLVAAGGIKRWKFDYEHSARTDSVEVFQGSQWHTTLPLPFALSAMSCAVINDTCYIIGGSKSGGLPNRQVCFVSIPSLLPTDTDHPESSKAATSSPKWEYRNCPLFFSTPVEQGGNLLAIGGKDDRNWPSSAVHKYMPSTKSWEAIANGTLPETNFHAAAVSLEGGDMIIVGGRDKPGSMITTVYISSKPIEQ